MDKSPALGQRGQGIVEFALVLPLFMLVLMGIITFGMAFSDYASLENVARSSARAAALGTAEKDIRAEYKTNPHLFVYTWDGSKDEYLKITVPEKDSKEKDVKVTIHATLNGFEFVNYVTNVVGFDRKKLDVDITYKMYNESGT